MTAAHIKKLISNRHSNDFFMTEIKTGPTWTPGQMRIIDALAIKKSYSNPKITAYEVKVSRQDFLRDNKYTEYFNFCNEFYFVCPKNLISLDEIEPRAGLIYCSEKSRKIVKKAQFVSADIPSQLYKYIIISRLESDRYPFFSDKKEYFQKWLENKLGNRTLGMKISNATTKKISEMQRNINKLKLDLKYWEQVAEMIDEKYTGRGYFRYKEVIKRLLDGEQKSSVYNDYEDGRFV